MAFYNYINFCIIYATFFITFVIFNVSLESNDKN